MSQQLVSLTTEMDPIDPIPARLYDELRSSTSAHSRRLRDVCEMSGYGLIPDMLARY
jgi:hypothetical protein